MSNDEEPSGWWLLFSLLLAVAIVAGVSQMFYDHNKSDNAREDQISALQTQVAQKSETATK